MYSKCCVAHHLQVVPEEEEYADQYEWVATGGKSHTFHIRPPILLHNLLPYPADITYEVSALVHCSTYANTGHVKPISRFTVPCGVCVCRSTVEWPFVVVG